MEQHVRACGLGAALGLLGGVLSFRGTLVSGEGDLRLTDTFVQGGMVLQMLEVIGLWHLC